MSFFRANAQIVGGSVENVTFSNPVSVEMGLKRVQNVADAVDDKDALNKQTLMNTLELRARYLDTTINGDNIAVVVDLRLFGIFHVSVYATDEGKPLSDFIVAKNKSNSEGTIQILIRLQGSNGSYLDARWPMNEGIQVIKRGSGDDGVYKVKIF